MYNRNATSGKKDELLTSGLLRLGRRTSSLRAMGLVLLLFTCHAVALSQSRPTELKWGELPQILEGQQVQLSKLQLSQIYQRGSGRSKLLRSIMTMMIRITWLSCMVM